MAEKLDLGDLIYRLGFDNEAEFLRALNKVFDRADDQAKKSGKQAGSSFAKDFSSALGTMTLGSFLGNTLANAFSSAMGATRQFIADSNQLFRSYQTSLNIIGASGAENLDKVKGKIKELSDEGKVFSENQIAQSLSEIIKAGYTTDQAITLVRSGMQAAKGEIDAATGAYADLSRTTLLVSDVLSGFSKDASEAARVTDILSAGANQSKLGFTDMVQALAPISGIANKVGLSLEQTTASIAKLRDTGLPATEASTQLRQILLQLITPPQELKKQMDALGLSITKADGSSRSFPEILDKIAGVANSGAKGVEFLGRVFGTYATNGALALAKSRDAVREFSISLDESEGAAKKWADEVNGNGVEAAKNYEREILNAKVALGKELQPVLADFYQSVAPLMVQALQGLIDKWKEWRLIITGTTPEIEQANTKLNDQIEARLGKGAAATLDKIRDLKIEIDLLQKTTSAKGIWNEGLFGLGKARFFGTGSLEGDIAQLKKDLAELERLQEEMLKRGQKLQEQAQAPYRQVLGSLSGGQSMAITQLGGENPNRMGYGPQGHNGTDIAISGGTGAKVFNPFDQARVIATGFDKYLGNYIKLALDNNTQVILGHFQSVGVKAGETLNKGVQLGLQGSTGNSTGPHVHVGFDVGGKTVYDQSELQRLMTEFGNKGAAGFSTGVSNVSLPTTSAKDNPLLNTAKDLEQSFKILDAQFARDGNIKKYKAGLTDLAAAYKALLKGASTLEEKVAVEEGLTRVSDAFNKVSRNAGQAKKEASQRDEEERKAQIRRNDEMATALLANYARQAEAENKAREERLRKNQEAAAQEQADNIALSKSDVKQAEWADQKEQSRAKAYKEQEDAARRKQELAQAEARILEETSNNIKKIIQEQQDSLEKAFDIGDGISGFRQQFDVLKVNLQDGTVSAEDFGTEVQRIIGDLLGFAEIAKSEGNLDLFLQAKILAGQLKQEITDLADTTSAYADGALKAAQEASFRAAQILEDMRNQPDSVDLGAGIKSFVNDFEAMRVQFQTGALDAKEFEERTMQIVNDLEMFAILQGQAGNFQLFDQANAAAKDLLDRLGLLIDLPTVTGEGRKPIGELQGKRSQEGQGDQEKQRQAFENSLSSTMTGIAKTFIADLTDGTPDIGAALQKALGSASDFFLNAMIEGIIGPIAGELAKAATSNLLGGAAGTAALGPIGLIVGAGLLIGSALFNQPKPAAAQATQSSSRASPSSITTRIETAISVYLQGGLENPRTRADIESLAESVTVRVLRRLNLLKEN